MTRLTNRCRTWLHGHICPDDLCRNATQFTLCGGDLEAYPPDPSTDPYDEEEDY